MTRRQLLGLGVTGLSGLYFGFWKAPTPARGVTLIGAGDIACEDSPGAWETARIIEDIPGTVFANGDLAYESGTVEDFQNYYGDSWGRFKNRTRPAIGNHDYGQGVYEDRDKSLYDPSAYFDYFGDVAGERGKGWYSYDIGTWHVVVLNSMYPLVINDGLQSQWLSSDLAVNTQPNLFSYWHHPVFSSGYHGSDERMKWAFEILYEYGCSVVVTGHDHTYERFALQDPHGNRDERGIRQFVVGTGGKSLRGASDTPLPNSEVILSDAFGVIKFTLLPESYEWVFIPTNREGSWDAGSCSVGRLEGMRSSRF
ncbi:MAG: metallophosphoesterase [Rubrobacter sp.]|nr:metallophosphoesterase [Rubrobacter sp.]